MDEILIQVTEVIEEITIIVSQPTEGGDAVSSVNGKIGDVNLDAADVGADTAGSAIAAEQNAKTYADSLVIGLLEDRGNFDASGNLFPVAGGSGAAGAIIKGDLWTISVAGVLGGFDVTAGDVVRALADTPGQTAANWVITENNIGYVPENSINKKSVINNSVVEFPNSSSVYNAFLKVRKLLFFQNTDSSVTGTIVETILTPNTFLIPAGTLKANSILHVEALLKRGATTLGIITFQAKANTSYSTVGAKTIYSTGSAFQVSIRSSGLIARVVNKNSNSTNNQPSISSFTMDTQSTNGVIATNIDWSVNQYVMITATLANAGDTATLDNVQFYVTEVE